MNIQEFNDFSQNDMNNYFNDTLTEKPQEEHKNEPEEKHEVTKHIQTAYRPRNAFIYNRKAKFE